MFFVFVNLVCPEGYYGDHCMEPCDCKNDFYICHPVEGCVCRHGYTGILFQICQYQYILTNTGIYSLLGPNCDEELFSRNIQERDETGYGTIVAGFLFAAIVVIAMTFAGWVYHRRRVADLKNEIAQVQYIAEPASPPGIYFK